ncbi:hypothetical protein H0B56_21415 [Haloechinothrix sp. YIM 98757]|uniref:Uncharacterized protein n=1 Tax=Haloechinothrix aidingensis TaxID=2752311 RepID=A0A838AFS1_9PSEU|nr:hypothetical protein [Haloechinothrix aidingensis]MBA0128113.1 hypothetical protein [Haloechinothrix aidingensis]
MHARPTSIFLLAFGVWSWAIWLMFARNLWASENSWAADGSPTSYFVVHAALTVVSIVLGTIIGVIGWRGLRASGPRSRDDTTSATNDIAKGR